ncbi:DNA sulfur modification protein DndB [Bacillus sp. FSL K6-1560]|uniref:DNA sulfur modification protein DndB n=1 Tax=Bacillus sp. FSL K6-1560 TaxID=2975293 RepID=UPI003157F406
MTVIFDQSANEKLLSEMKDAISKNKHIRSFINDIQLEMAKNKITPGTTQKLIYDIENPEVEISKEYMYFLAKSLYSVLESERFNPRNYFTETDMREIETLWEGSVEEDIKFPYTFKQVVKYSDDNYFFPITAKELFMLFENKLLHYNPNAQRTNKTKKLEGSDIEIPVPQLNKQSVEEIKELFLDGKLIKSVFTFNARVGSASGGEELKYDDDTMSLTVTEDTILDVLDGYHRLIGITMAIRQHPELDHLFEETFKVDIYNYTQKRAREHFGQQNTINPVKKSKVAEMSQNVYSNKIVKFIQDNSIIGDYIKTNGDWINQNQNLLITFSDFKKAIERSYSKKDFSTQADILKTARYLTSFFDALATQYVDEFLGDIAKERKRSFVNNYLFFNGYVGLAKKLQLDGVSLDELESKITDVLGSIDFSKKNKLWDELGVVDKNGNAKSPQKIWNFFNNLKIDE